jgi:hypothetical protein
MQKIADKNQLKKIFWINEMNGVDDGALRSLRGDPYVIFGLFLVSTVIP